MKYIITAGGTGGHIYPALAIINKIKERDKNAKFLYIGTTDRMEKDIIPSLGIKYEGIKINGLSKNPIKLIKAIFLTINDISKCKKIIKDFEPDIVIGVGGYVTVPVIYAASKLKVKTLLHEQNSVVGKANTFLAKYSSVICVSMESSLKYFKKYNAVYTGNPRAEEACNIKSLNKKDLGLDESKKLVLITTGSLGAKTVNDVIQDSLDDFEKKSYQVIFVTGKKSYDNYKNKIYNNIKIVPYMDDMIRVMKTSDLIISRAGATTIAEITALGIPSILIPSPYVANNHQYYNAVDLEKNGACVVIEESNLTKKNLLNTVDKILEDDVLYKSLKKGSYNLGVRDSASRIYNEIKKLLK